MITDLKIHCFLWPKIKGDSFQFVQVPPTHITPHRTYIKSTLHFLVNISFKPCNILPDGSTHLWKGGGGRRRRQEKKKKKVSLSLHLSIRWIKFQYYGIIFPVCYFQPHITA